MITDFSSPNFDTREGAAIDMLILHYTGMETGKAALQKLCGEDAKNPVSAHYLVEEDGRVFQLVAEEYRAWHAGKSFWAGREDINAHSIGVEIVNPGHELGYREFPQAQIKAVTKLCRGIIEHHNIPQHLVLGHSDVAPDRKEDPGELFPWTTLAKGGVGLWAAAYDVTIRPDVRKAMDLLAHIGYKTGTNLEMVQALKAFQRHYRPNLVNGKLDEITFGRIAALAELVDDHRKKA